MKQKKFSTISLFISIFIICLICLAIYVLTDKNINIFNRKISNLQSGKPIPESPKVSQNNKTANKLLLKHTNPNILCSKQTSYSKLNNILTKISNEIIPSVQAIKPTVPIELNVCIEDQLELNKDTIFKITITPLVDARSISLNVENYGTVTIKNISNNNWNNIPAKQAQNSQVLYQLNEEGEGEIRVSINYFDKTGQNYGKRQDIFFLATKKVIFTGSSGKLSLKQEYLQYKLDSGEINKNQYQEELDKILGGGAKETN